jgi:hypothetical protein
MARTPVPNPNCAWRLAAAVALVLLSGCRDRGQAPDVVTPSPTVPSPGTPNDPPPPQLTSGPTGRDFQHPWVVRVAGNLSCHGTLIHPRWVLTAAHCVTTGTTATTGVRKITSVSYTRVDPSGATHTATRQLVNGVGLQVHLHEDFRHGFEEHDIALVQLATPFELEPGLQVAALPGGPRTTTVGTVATYNRSGLQPGQVGLFRGPIPDGAGSSFTVLRPNPADALDEGDSGSGVVSQEGAGRAVVRGVASVGGANRDPSFTDVFAHRAWILGKLGTSPELLEGFTRVARRGGAADGIMKIDCPNPHGAMSGPMYADGSSLGANCTAGQPQRVECTATRAIADTVMATPFGITEFAMRTSCPPNAPTVELLPHGAQQAVFNGPAAQSPDPVGICIREFTCRVGTVQAPVLEQ